MNIQLGYGHGEMTLRIDRRRSLCLLRPVTPRVTRGAREVIREALEKPIGSTRLREIASGRRVAIIASDITRPCPTSLMLPEVVRELNEAGVPDRDITVVFGLGIHRGHTTQERQGLAGASMHARLHCVDSDPGDTIRVGVTKRGTPVDVFKPVVDAGLRICLGNIEPHYFAGYSGGGKAIMPGVCGRSSIEGNHSQMLDSGAVAGQVDGNPVRADIDEAASLVGVDFILNVVLDESKRVVGAVAGDLMAAHRHGCGIADGVYKTRVPAPADVVVVAAGGHPKDLNLYQAQKSLENAQHALKDGGTLVLVAACTEGLGDRVFERWLNEARSPREVMERIRHRFELGGHKAVAIARVVERARVFLVSDLPDHLVRRVWMKPFKTAEEALETALNEQGPGAMVTVIPHGGSTLPEIAGSPSSSRL
ncbi:MAG: nickel-dependent lactate racemase [Ignavibacteriales bacterium]